MTFEEALESLSTSLKLEEPLKTDENDMVILDVDDMSIILMTIPGTPALCMVADMGFPPPEDNMEKLYEALLKANYDMVATGGATFSMNPTTQDIQFCRILPLADYTDEKLYSEFEGYINTLSMWRKLIADYRAGDGDVKVEGGDDMNATEDTRGSDFPPRDALPGMSFNGFMQV